MDAPPAWSQVHRIGFRLTFSYFVLYLVPFPLGYLPKTDWLAEKFDELWKLLVPWFGENVLGTGPIEQVMTGSGDTTFDWVKTLVMLIIAVLATGVWTALDRRRTHYRGLQAGLRVYVRYSLAAIMIGYGLAKVFKSQFPSAEPATLITRIGDQSPMGLLWTMMGFSPAYNVFTGGAECVGGLLLLWRRTTSVGAIVSFGVMLQVFMLNMCFDVPVKLFSFHLLVFSAFLLAPDAKRLFDAVALGRRVEAAALEPRWKWPRFSRAQPWIKHVVVFGMLLYMVHTGRKSAAEWGDAAPRPSWCKAMCGVWDVDEYGPPGASLPKLTTETERWRQVAISRFPVWKRRFMDDTTKYLRAEVDEAAHTVTFSTGETPSVMTYTMPTPDRIELTGPMEGKELRIVMVRRDEKWLLYERGFHWINEYPFNR